MKFETARIQVPSDVFAAVVVVLVSQAPYYLSSGKKVSNFRFMYMWRYKYIRDTQVARA